MDAQVRIKATNFWAGIASAAAFPLAALLIWVDLRMIASLWEECGLDDASNGISFNFTVFPMTVFFNLFLIPIAALLFAGCRRVAIRLVDKGRSPDLALGLAIPVGVVLTLAAAALTSMLAMSAANAQVSPDYPTSCVELGNGNA